MNNTLNISSAVRDACVIMSSGTSEVQIATGMLHRIDPFITKPHPELGEWENRATYVERLRDLAAAYKLTPGLIETKAEFDPKLTWYGWNQQRISKFIKDEHSRRKRAHAQVENNLIWFPFSCLVPGDRMLAFFISRLEYCDESATIAAQNGNVAEVVLSWQGKKEEFDVPNTIVCVDKQENNLMFIDDRGALGPLVHVARPQSVWFLVVPVDEDIS